MSVVVVYGGKEFEDADELVDVLVHTLREAPDRAVRQISKSLQEYLQRVARLLKERHGTHWSPGNQGGPDLHVRSGAGIASIMKSIALQGQGSFETLQGSISTGTMAIHETGGHIAATGGGWLTIPLPAALDARGLPIYPSARDWPNTFTQMSRKGNLIIFQNRGRRSPVPLYVLKKSVYIPPRLGMEKQILGELPYFTERLIDQLAAEFAK